VREFILKNYIREYYNHKILMFKKRMNELKMTVHDAIVMFRIGVRMRVRKVKTKLYSMRKTIWTQWMFWGL